MKDGNLVDDDENIAMTNSAWFVLRKNKMSALMNKYNLNVFNYENLKTKHTIISNNHQFLLYP